MFDKVVWFNSNQQDISLSKKHIFELFLTQHSITIFVVLIDEFSNLKHVDLWILILKELLNNFLDGILKSSYRACWKKLVEERLKSFLKIVKELSKSFLKSSSRVFKELLKNF